MTGADAASRGAEHPLPDWPMAAVVAAAGEGRRFGGRKLLAPWPGGTVLEAVVGALMAGGLAPVVVVVAADGDGEARVATAMGAHVVVRPPGVTGDLGASIALGVRSLLGPGTEWLLAGGVDAAAAAAAVRGPETAIGASAGTSLAERAPAIAVVLGDLPRLRPETVAQLVGAWRDAPDAGRAIVVPIHGGRRGHPVIFGPRHAAALAALRPDGRPRDVLSANRSSVREIAVDDAGIWRDVDRRGDLSDG